MEDENSQQKKNSPAIRAVNPLDRRRLHIEFVSGSSLELNMENRLHTTRYYDLNSDAIFRSVSTDGEKLFFDTGSSFGLEILPREAVHMAMKSPGDAMGILRIQSLERGLLHLEMKSGSSLTLNLESWMNLPRYSPLKKPEILQSISTDGENLFFGNTLRIEEEKLIRLMLR